MADVSMILIPVFILPVYCITHIIYGAWHMGQCPIQPYIPIYLLVLGCLGLLLTLAVPVGCCLWISGHRNITVCFCVWIAVDAIFLLCWVIIGNVWIFSIYEPNNSPTSGQYCQETVYQWAFWNTVVVDLVLGLLLTCGCCYLVFVLIRCFIVGRFYCDEAGQTDPLIATGSRGAEAVAPTPAIYGC